MSIVSPSIWRDILARVRRDRPDVYRGWFAELRPLSLDGGVVRVGVGNPAQHRHLLERCSSVFDVSAQIVTGRLVRVQFEPPPEDLANARTGMVVQFEGGPRWASPFQPDMTFDVFVDDAGNRLAFAAALTVAQDAEPAYDPLLLIGNGQVGKTHLLHAIGNMILGGSAGRVACLCTARTLAAALIAALEDGRVERLREELTGPDVLLVDDLHELVHFPRTQEAFFHLMNARSALGRRLVAASRHDPASLEGLPDRIVTRLRSGLVSTMDPPSAETRRAVVNQLARRHGLELGDEDLECLGQHSEETRPDYDSILQALAKRQAAAPDSRGSTPGGAGERPAPAGEEASLHEIATAVERRFGVTGGALRTASRHRGMVLPRHAAMYLSRRLTTIDTNRIGSFFGGRQGALVLRAARLVERRMLGDSELRRRVETIARDLGDGRRETW